MSIPPVLQHASKNSIILSDGTMFMPISEATHDSRERWPELFIENQLPAIRTAAVNTMFQLLRLTDGMELFSLQEILDEALKEIHNVRS